MTFIDTHCHLDLCKNNKEMIENAKRKNVRILTCGVDVDTNKKALEFSKMKNVEACLGIYPSNCLKLSDEKIDAEIDFIRKNREKIVAISEVGLDLMESSELDKQIKNFEKFINLAKELNLPIVVHSRKAEKNAVDFLEKFDYDKVVMHCFCGNFKLVKRIIENKWFFNIPTNVKFSEHFQKLVEITPIEQLFCETDSPYLHPNKKFPNEPANVIESYKKIAEIKKLKLNEVEKIIEGNFERVFGTTI